MDEAEIRSTSTADGVRIAYWTFGSGPPVVVLHPPAMSNLKRELAIAPLRSWYERLGEQSRVVRLSQRGFGSSQRDGVEVTLDNFVRDVEAVVEALAVEQVGILASAIGSPAAVAYAARHPERVTKLVLFSPFLGYAGDELAVGIGRARAVARLGTLVWTRTVAKWLDPGGVVDSQAMQAVLTESVSADAHGN